MYENDADKLREDVIQPLQMDLKKAIVIVGETMQYTASEREQLSNQLACCQIVLSTFEHILITQRRFSELQEIDFRRSVHDVSSIVANINYFDRKIKQHWSHLNPGHEQAQEAVNA